MKSIMLWVALFFIVIGSALTAYAIYQAVQAPQLDYEIARNLQSRNNQNAAVTLFSMNEIALENSLNNLRIASNLKLNESTLDKMTSQTNDDQIAWAISAYRVLNGDYPSNETIKKIKSMDIDARNIWVEQIHQLMLKNEAENKSILQQLEKDITTLQNNKVKDNALNMIVQIIGFLLIQIGIVIEMLRK